MGKYCVDCGKEKNNNPCERCRSCARKLDWKKPDYQETISQAVSKGVKAAWERGDYDLPKIKKEKPDCPVCGETFAGKGKCCYSCSAKERATPEWVERMSKAVRRAHRKGAYDHLVSPERREAKSRIMKQLHAEGVFRGREEKISRSVKLAWARGDYEGGWTDERRRKLSETKRRQHEEGIYRNVQRNPSELAKSVWGAIRANGYKAELEHTFNGHSYDIFVPALNLLVEVDGEYWHYSERAKEQGVPKRDAQKESLARAGGFRFMRIRERDVKMQSLKEDVAMWLKQCQ